MSKKVKESLFELIKSLSKSEKRYFKLLASRHTIGEENNYVILFDFIEKQLEYDENLIFEKFKGEPFLNKFSITKKRLYDHILNALDSFHNTTSIESQLYKMIHSADILYDKSLYEQSKTILRSAEKLAEKKNLFNVLLIIKNKQKKIYENTSYTEISKDEIDLMYSTDINYHNQSLLYDKLWNIKSQLFYLLSNKGSSRSQLDIQDFKNIIDELAATLDHDNWYFETHYLFHHIYSAYYFAVNDLENCYKHLIENITYFESNEVYIKNHSNKYFSILTNAIFVSDKIGFRKDSIQLFHKLKELPHKLDSDNNEDIQIKLFSSISSLEINMLLQHGEFQEASKLIGKIKSGLITYDEKITIQRKIYLQYKIAVTYLSIAEYSSALKWINIILNNKSLDQKEDVFAYTQILSVLVHIELNNYDLLNYTIKNTLRFLKSRNRLFEPEKAFLTFVSKLRKSKDIFEKEFFWEEIHSELKEIYKDTNNAVSLDYFDLLSWTEAKYKRKIFQEIVQSKFKMKSEKFQNS
ncbi:MAG: hypothetical protein HYR91_05070 [Flavobacteriia bacterium]|nr:hypothetical protein [Flavobacteriia bacterium]